MRSDRNQFDENLGEITRDEDTGNVHLNGWQAGTEDLNWDVQGGTIGANLGVDEPPREGSKRITGAGTKDVNTPSGRRPSSKGLRNLPQGRPNTTA
ncbi:MAG TPA: hypothetical protein VFZ48_00155 [Candidatus Saccharimonadales bacterium]